jgi:adenosylmethionine-8-amino-7-oxononanoate aminotransferase
MRLSVGGRPIHQDGGVTLSRIEALAADPECLLATDRAHLWHPYDSMLDPAPVLPVRTARGVRLELADGRELIDGTASWWTAIHGYHHPALDRALAEQARTLPHVMFGGLTHAPAAALAELLVELTPGPLRHVFFADSGSVSVEVALKMAIQYWRSRGRPAKSRMLTVRGGYHGDTFGAMSVCDPVNGMHHLFASVLATQTFAPRPPAGFDADLDQAYLDGLANLIRQQHGELAGVILEPVVQNAGGIHMYAPGYLTALRKLCDEYELLLIADEIAVGFGRTGTLFGCDQAGIAPDIMCVGKALTGGYLSLAAAICTPAVAEGICRGSVPVLMHGPTYMANPLACAVGVASLEVLRTGAWRTQVADIQGWLRAGLAPARGLPGVADVRVLGAVGVIQTAAPVDVPAVQRVALDHGVWLRPFNDLVYTMPPYLVTEEETRAITAAMVASCR